MLQRMCNFVMRREINKINVKIRVVKNYRNIQYGIKTPSVKFYQIDEILPNLIKSNNSSHKYFSLILSTNSGVGGVCVL